MSTRSLVLTMLMMVLSSLLWAQPPYRQVSSSDLVGGYMASGEWIESESHDPIKRRWCGLRGGTILTRHLEGSFECFGG